MYDRAAGRAEKAQRTTLIHHENEAKKRNDFNNVDTITIIRRYRDFRPRKREQIRVYDRFYEVTLAVIINRQLTHICPRPTETRLIPAISALIGIAATTRQDYEISLHRSRGDRWGESVSFGRYELTTTGGDDMPIKMICSRCGGLGTLEFLCLLSIHETLQAKPLYEDIQPGQRVRIGKHPYWRTEPCPDCTGAGRLEVLSFEESRGKINGSHTPIPPPTGGTPKI